MIQSVDITLASVHDIHILKDVKISYTKCTLLGDMGCISADIQLNLFDSVQIKLETPMCKNQTNCIKQPYIFKKEEKEL